MKATVCTGAVLNSTNGNGFSSKPSLSHFSHENDGFYLFSLIYVTTYRYVLYDSTDYSVPGTASFVRRVPSRQKSLCKKPPAMYIQSYLVATLHIPYNNQRPAFSWIIFPFVIKKKYFHLIIFV